MSHVIIYYGPFEENFRLLSPRTTTYVLPGGKQSSIISKPESVDGLGFACMQDGKVYQAVKAGNVVVRMPVEIIPGVHTPMKTKAKGKEFGPSQYTIIHDAHARRLLKDLIAKNPLQLKALLAAWP